MAARQSTKKLAVLTGIALAAVIVVGSFAGSDSVADDLTPKAYMALVDDGLSGVTVDFDGREATLSNGTPEQLAQAVKVVEAVAGVRRATIDADPTNVAEPPTFSLSRNTDGVNLSGVVPNADIAAQLKAAASATFGSVTGDLRVDPNVGTADWLTTMSTLIPDAADVDDLSISVDGDSLALGGSLDSQAEVDALTALVDPSLGDLSFDNTLEVGSGASAE